MESAVDWSGGQRLPRNQRDSRDPAGAQRRSGSALARRKALPATEINGIEGISEFYDFFSCLQTNRGFNMETKRQIKSSVKDESLIEMRREQMIQGAVKLFKEKGFHRTTTREIAKEAGFSIGTLYEYIRTKEDVLFLVCDSIYNEVNDRLYVLAKEEGTVKGLRSAIQQYFELIDDMSDEFVVMYQESKSLPKDALQYVLKKEMEMVALFENILQSCAELGELRIKQDDIQIAAHHIVVQGQMWAFRRWALQKNHSIEKFIEIQTDQIFKGIVGTGDIHEEGKGV
jgi:TetR/AcrR family transcriptional regulator, cholesterol catabolism regulator